VWKKKTKSVPGNKAKQESNKRWCWQKYDSNKEEEEEEKEEEEEEKNKKKKQKKISGSLYTYATEP
jgi:hypothetical protein